MLFIPSFCGAAMLGVFALFQLARLAGADPADHADWSAIRLDKRFKSFAAEEPSPNTFRLAFLGDSTVGPYVDDQRLSRYVRFHLKQPPRIAPNVILADAAFIGAGIVTEYFFVDRIIEQKPNLIVWQVSLLHFSDDWQGKIRTELAGWLGAERFGELFTLPLQDLGVRMDGFLMHQTVVRAGLLDVWATFSSHQAAVRDLLPRARKWLAEDPGFDAEESIEEAIRYRHWRRIIGPKSRLTREGEEIVIGRSLRGLEANDPILRILQRALETYTDHGVSVLVYLTPVDVQNIEKVGAARAPDLARSADAIRSVVEASGARFLDLHDLYGDDAFATWPHHYILSDERDAVSHAKAIADDIRVFIKAAPAKQR